MRLDKVIEDVGRAVAQVEFGQWGFAVSQIDLSIATVDVIENGVKIGIGVVEAGAILTVGQARTVTVSLEPRIAKRELREDSLLDGLVNGIRDAAQALEITGDKLPDWGLKSATVEVGFSVDGGGKFSVGLTGGAGRSHEHTVKLTLVAGDG